MSLQETVCRIQYHVMLQETVVVFNIVLFHNRNCELELPFFTL